MRLKRHLKNNGTLYLFVFFAAVALKLHFSCAEVADLRWVLAPTTWLVSVGTGVHFDFNVDVGYIATQHHVFVTEACAGVNFIVISFCMLSLTFANRVQTRKSKLALLAASALVAYSFTLLVNAVRIALWLRIADTVFVNGWPETTVHRIEGILVYFTALCLLYTGSEWLYQRWIHNVKRAPATAPPPSPRFTFYIPLFWYLLIVVGVPLACMLYRGETPHFFEHIAIVLAVTMSLVFGVGMLQRGYSGLPQLGMRGRVAKSMER